MLRFVVEARQLSVLLKLLHSVGSQLAESQDGAYHRAWGRHLLEDWRGLELMAQRLEAREGLDGPDHGSQQPELTTVENVPVQPGLA